MTPELIYCADGGARFADIAVESGFLYGIQVPGTAHYPVYFADHDWKRPNRDAYMRGLEKHRPQMATVLDWEREEQLSDVLSWAAQAASVVQTVVIVPKVMNAIEQLPREVGRAQVRLGYSVPTRYGATELPTWQFSGWPIHLLGGSPQRQMELAYYLDVRSVDGNMAHKLAIRWAQFWAPGNARYAQNRYWPKLSEAGLFAENDAPYRAFELSCKNIIQAWGRRE